VIALGAGAAWAYFGSMLPNTLVAKQAMAVAEGQRFAGLGFWTRIVPMAPRFFGTPWPALAVAGVLGLVPWWKSAGLGGRLLIAEALALALYYPLSGVQFFSWYVAPTVAVLMIGAGHLAAMLVRAAAAAARERKLPRAALAAVAGTAVVLLMAASVLASWRWYRGFGGYAHLATYRRAAEWLAVNVPPGTRVAYVEIGVLGYYAHRPIQDLMGLVSPEVLPAVERGDIVAAFLTRPTEVVLFHTRGRMGPIVSAPWFDRFYREVAAFDEPAPAGQRRGMKVFRLRDGMPLPTAAAAGSAVP
jgi:hypothetical protein